MTCWKCYLGRQFHSSLKELLCYHIQKCQFALWHLHKMTETSFKMHGIHNFNEEDGKHPVSGLDFQFNCHGKLGSLCCGVSMWELWGRKWGGKEVRTRGGKPRMREAQIYTTSCSWTFGFTEKWKLKIYLFSWENGSVGKVVKHKHPSSIPRALFLKKEKFHPVLAIQRPGRGRQAGAWGSASSCRHSQTAKEPETQAQFFFKFYFKM